MSKLRALSRAAWMAGIVSASLLTVAGSTARAQSADELLAQAANRPTPRGAAKSDGSRYTNSAARYADVKREVHVPRTAAKRDDREPFADPALPIWLRLSSTAAEDESLRNVPEVGLLRMKSKADLQSIFETIFRNSSSKYVEDDYPKVLKAAGDAQLEGLPFQKGKAWKLDDKQAAALNWTSTTIRTILDAAPAAPEAKQPAVAKSATMEVAHSLTAFFGEFKWANVEALRTKAQRGQNLEELDITSDDTASSAVLPGLMQILAVQAPRYRLDLVRQLQSQVSGDDAATAALVRLALFDADAEVRRSAVKALQREPRDTVGRSLLAAFRYPWHIIAERAAAAIVELDRADLLPALVDLLDEEDPTTPFERTAEGRKELAVREVVKINHNRNCLVCHRPAGIGASREAAVLLALTPSPDEALPPLTSRLYYNTGSGTAIRASDVYLRQDFSVLQKVENPGVWPEMQRYDFLIRTRVLSAPEAKARNQAGDEQGAPTPNRRAVLYALTRLTSIYAGETADDWRPQIARFLAAQKTAAVR